MRSLVAAWERLAKLVAQDAVDLERDAGALNIRRDLRFASNANLKGGRRERRRTTKEHERAERAVAAKSQHQRYSLSEPFSLGSSACKRSRAQSTRSPKGSSSRYLRK